MAGYMSMAGIDPAIYILGICRNPLYVPQKTLEGNGKLQIRSVSTGPALATAIFCFSYVLSSQHLCINHKPTGQLGLRGAFINRSG